MTKEEARKTVEDILAWGEAIKTLLEESCEKKTTIESEMLEHANAIKQYCQKRDRSGVLCEGCPFVFYRGTDECCALNNDLCPADWYWENQK